FRSPLVGSLFGDLRVELSVDTDDVDLPVEVSVIDLLDPVDALHETGEFLELGPLVVDGAHVSVDVDRLGHVTHGCLLSGWTGGAYPDPAGNKPMGLAFMRATRG